MNDKVYLQRAIELAKKSREPVGCACVAVDGNGEVIAEAFNSQRQDGLVISHAEIKAIAQANKKLGRKLRDVTVYGNCEPCPMCLTAMIFAGVERVVFAKRLNDLFGPGDQINIDSFEFVKQFSYQPKIELVRI